MSDVREELDHLRRDVDRLLARLSEGNSEGEYGGGSSGQVNAEIVRHLKEAMAREGKTSGICIARVVVFHGEGGTAVASGIITSVDPTDFRKPTKLRESVGALATDSLALRAVRRLAEEFFINGAPRMSKQALAASLGASEGDLENSLRSLVADDMIHWRQLADGEQTYSFSNQEPHALLVQSLE